MRTTADLGATASWRVLALLAALALALAACGTDEATDGEAGEATDGDAGEETGGDAGEAEYAGSELTWVVMFGPGGDYDLLAREMAPFLSEELGVNVVVDNQPGAGGLVAWNNLYRQEGDVELISWATGQGLVGSVLAEQEGVEFELEEFTWLGRASAEPRILTTGADGRIESVDDLLEAEGVTFGSTGPGSSSYIDGSVIFDGMGVDGEHVTGFEGDPEIWLALNQGNVDLASGPLGVNIRPVEAGEHRLLLVLGDERLPDYPDVPHLLELDLPEEQLAILEAHVASSQLGRLMIAPPGIPEDQAAVLEQALMNIWTDPELQEVIHERSTETLDPVDGEAAWGIAQSVLDADPAYKALLIEALTAE